MNAQEASKISDAALGIDVSKSEMDDVFQKILYSAKRGGKSATFETNVYWLRRYGYAVKTTIYPMNGLRWVAEW